MEKELQKSPVSNPDILPGIGPSPIYWWYQFELTDDSACIPSTRNFCDPMSTKFDVKAANDCDEWMFIETFPVTAKLQVYDGEENQIYRRIKKFNESYRFLTLQKKFLTQKSKFSFLLTGKEIECEQAFYLVGYRLNKLNASKVKVSLTESPSLFFSLEFDQLVSKQLRFEIFFDGDDFRAAYSLYGNGSLLKRSYGEVEDMLSEIEREQGQLSINTQSLGELESHTELTSFAYTT